MKFWGRKSVSQQTHQKRFLIIRLSSIGDIVLTTPVIRCLRKKYPDAIIDFLVKPAFKAVLAANPYISNILLYQPEDAGFLSSLKNHHYDCIIDLHHNLRTMKIKRSLSSTSHSFPKLNVPKWIYVHFKTSAFLPDKSIVERYFEAVRALGVVNDGEGLDYFIEPEMVTKQEDIPMSHWTGFVACVLGGSKGTKQLPTDKWIEFALQCELPIILLGGPDDKSQGDEIAQVIPAQRVYNACGKFKLNESADLIQRSRVVVANDTGLMHIAAAYQKPIVSLWGNTTPELGMFPYYGANNLTTVVASKLAIVQVKGLSCRPCSKIGYESCPKKHFKCMNRIDTKEMVDYVYSYWGKKI